MYAASTDVSTELEEAVQEGIQQAALEEQVDTLRNARRHSSLMPCYQPIRVAILRKTAVNGGRRVRDMQEVACGHCLGCRAEQGRQWAVRMMHESQMHDHSWFLTLTYDEENLPENGSLSPRDPQSFFKSLRKGYPAGSVSYYVCGEYGPKTNRPHYHAVLFGPDLSDRVSLPDRNGHPTWWSPTVENHWRRGIHDLSTVNFASAAYVASYVQKKAFLQENPDLYLRVDPDTGELLEVEPEFARMSRNPAIGRRWIEKFWKDVYPRDYVVVDGVETKPPRYYDKWMELPPEKGGSRERQAIMMEVRQNRWKEEWDDSQYKRKARAAIHEARLNLYPRGDEL